MAPSMRTPTKKQGAVLFTLHRLREAAPDAWPGTTLITTELARIQDELKSQQDRQPQADVLHTLNAFINHEWVVREVAFGIDRDNKGSHLRWHLTDAGSDALQRALQANQPKENVVEPTTTEPTATAPWETEPDTQGEELEQEVSLNELDEEDVPETEIEIEEDDNPPVNEASNQLTLAIGGPKPKSSILKIMSKQQKFGSTRQFRNMERIPFSGFLEVRGVAIDVQANGFVQRMQKAVISELVIDGIDVSDNND